MGEESLDFRDAHVAGVTLVVEQDVAPGPTDVGFLGANRVVFDPDEITSGQVAFWVVRSFQAGIPQ